MCIYIYIYLFSIYIICSYMYLSVCTHTQPRYQSQKIPISNPKTQLSVQNAAQRARALSFETLRHRSHSTPSTASPQALHNEYAVSCTLQIHMHKTKKPQNTVHENNKQFRHRHALIRLQPKERPFALNASTTRRTQQNNTNMQ